MLDLGAGTGKLTTRLVERGLGVVAVDPIPEMLELLSNSLPDTPALLGTAEEIPLPDDSVDAVLVAQAWHWFDPERAIKEVARVLRPGGRLGLVWNTRDERMGWVKDLGRIIGHEDDPFSHKVTLCGTVRQHRTPPGGVDELPDAAGTYRPRRIPQLLHHLTDRRAHPNPGAGARTAGDSSRAGQHHGAGAALRHGVHPRDAVLRTS